MAYEKKGRFTRIFINDYDEIREGWQFAGIMTIALGLVVVITLSVSAWFAHLEMPGYEARLAQFRINFTEVGCTAAEDVMGYAVVWNSRIMKEQRYNDIWWSAWLVPNAWDELELLDIPDCP
ncbi:MAG: hypothetical protein KOO63_07875 [Bacteroidales bacterium]|nr:hypothetical protein [Candidatus Latescibacterota bacterium]